MRTTRRQFLETGTAIAIASVNSACRVPAVSPRPGPWKTLFDGRSLEQWHPNPTRIGHGTGGLWRIEDGILTGRQDPPGSGNGGLLLTNEAYGDFELDLELRPDWGLDSGVFFRATEMGRGFQMYVDYHDNGNVGHLRGEVAKAFPMMPFRFDGVTDESGKLIRLQTKPDPRRAKWPTGVYRHICSPGDWLESWKLDDWNRARIRCYGEYPRVMVRINDLPVCDWDGSSSTHPLYDRRRVFDSLGRRGSIGLQIHGGSKYWPARAVCRWRNIRIRKLY